jgi:hypothetical protein
MRAKLQVEVEELREEVNALKEVGSVFAASRTSARPSVALCFMRVRSRALAMRPIYVGACVPTWWLRLPRIANSHCVLLYFGSAQRRARGGRGITRNEAAMRLDEKDSGSFSDDLTSSD